MTRRWAVWRITRERREVPTDAGVVSSWVETEQRLGVTLEAPTYADAWDCACLRWPDYALLDRLDVRELLRWPGT